MRLETDKKHAFRWSAMVVIAVHRKACFLLQGKCWAHFFMRLFSMALNGYDRSRNFIFDEVRSDDEELAAFGR